MASSHDLVFSSLYLPRPLSAGLIGGFLARLAADRASVRVALEARAEAGEVRYLLGCRPVDVHGLRQMLGDLVPGAGLGSPSPRPAVSLAAKLRIQPPGLPLLSDNPEGTVRSMLSVLASVRTAGDHAVVQIVLGPRYAPKLVPVDAPAPGRSFLRTAFEGNRPASGDVRNRMKERLAQGGFAAVIRIGTASADSSRARRFIMGLLSAISTAQSPGVHVDLLRDSPLALDSARQPWRWPLRMAVGELVGLLGWPLGEDDLPGVPPLHPKPLRAAPSVHTGPRVFATSAVPGDDRELGISPADQTYHGIAYGPSGSGKSNAILHLIMADIEAGRPVAVLDPKKQLIDDIAARMPESRLGDVVFLDAADPEGVGFNPLDVTGRDPDVVVDGLMAVFEAVFREGWGPRTADIFSACLRTLARTSSATRPATLLDIPTLLTDGSFRRKLVGRVQDDIALAGFWAWYDSQTPQAQAAAIAAPLNKLRQFLLRPALVRMLGSATDRFRLRDIFRQHLVVLVPLNEGLIGAGTASLLGSLVVADLWQATQERAGDPDVGTRQSMIYVDEAPRFLNLPMSLEDALAVSRSLGVGWFLAAQFRAQFPAPLRAAVDMNARSKIVFGTEYEDARETAKLARDLTLEDVMVVPRYHAYVNLVADGHPSGWALVKTLPPSPTTTDPEQVRAVARANYGNPRPSATPDSPNPEAADAPEPMIGRSSAPSEPIGRKRRQR
jgi:hypothetical protein